MAQLICTPFSYIVSFVNSLTGNYIIALLVFTLVMKLVLFPLSAKQQKNSVRQAKLRPKEEAIRAKYAGRNDKPTQQKMQQEIMQMYQDEKFSPFSGCLPLLLQLPLLLILYGIVRQPLLYTARYNAQEIEALNAAVAITEYYEDRAATEGAVGGDFRLEETEQGLIFYDPATGLDNLVKFDSSADKGIVDIQSIDFYTITEAGEQGEAVKENLLAHVVGDNNVPADESSLVTELKDNAEHYSGIYTAIRENLELTDTDTAEELNLAERLPTFKLFGGKIDLGDRPNLSNFDWLMVFPILTFLTSFLSQWLTRKFTYQPQQAAETQGSLRLMNVMMPLMSAYISFIVPCALAVYWIIQNFISPIQQIILSKLYPVPKYTPEELKKAKDEYVAKQKGKADKRSIPAPKRRSLVYDDDEDEVTPELPKGKAEVKEEEKEVLLNGSPIGKAQLKDEPSKQKKSK